MLGLAEVDANGLEFICHGIKPPPHVGAGLLRLLEGFGVIAHIIVAAMDRNVADGIPGGFYCPPCGFILGLQGFFSGAVEMDNGWDHIFI